MPPTITEKQLDAIENAIASLAQGIACFKPIALDRSANADLAAIIARVEAHGGGRETRPFTLPEHRQVGGRIT